MVENRNQPAVTRMTAGASGAQAALMGIVVNMTADASGIGILEAVTLVARTAGRDGVQPGQWERRQVVIKAYWCVPRSLRVAAAALACHLATVRVVHCVTGRAGRRNLARG